MEENIDYDYCYGFYLGQDPRDFEPDFESCTEKEIAAWKRAVDICGLCEGEDKKIPSFATGCHYTNGFCIDAPTFGIGVNILR